MGSKTEIVVKRDPSVANSAWEFFSDERGLPFYYLKFGSLEYLQISGKIRYPNDPSVSERS